MFFNFFKRPKKVKSNEKTETENSEILIRYCYEWNEDVPENERDTQEHPSREFCKKLIELNRFYSRSEIEKISEIVGYSVWDRKGGEGCRHRWVAKTVKRKI